MKARVLLIVLGMVLLGGVVQANEFEDNFSVMVRRWQRDRDELSRDMVRRWLRGADADALRPDLVRLMQLDVRLATQPDIPLYVNSITDADNMSKSISQVVMAHLRIREVDFPTARLFAGQQYQMLNEDVRPDMTFMNWQNRKE